MLKDTLHFVGFSDGYRFRVTGLLRTAGTFKEVSKPQPGYRAFR